MAIKDHYKTLEIPPHATIPEIRKAYRRLAQQYHPDKNNNDPYAAAQFAAIKEAYEVLTTPALKNDYLQQRWYHQTTGTWSVKEQITPVTILKQAIELDRYAAQLDVFRMDKQTLLHQLRELLNDEAIAVLQQFNDKAINQQIGQQLLKPMKLLTAVQAREFGLRVQQLPGIDEAALQKTIHQVYQQERKEKYKWYWLLLALVALCLLIRFGNSGR